MDISERVVFGGYSRFVPSGPFASVLVQCRAARSPSALVRLRHTNGTPCTSASLWCGPFVSYLLTLAVLSSRPAHRRDVAVYRPRRRTPSAVWSAFVCCRVCCVALSLLLSYHLNKYWHWQQLAITHVHWGGPHSDTRAEGTNRSLLIRA